ncbi:hypothetical protein [Chryseobacterium sp. OV279]|uniref:hypothetical protein n=1 Tax=Chryseobacterium sp. OV279 TaxID=1500285 RepID=UPI00091EB4C4|nr:hypothetical protein [Chryseobacterium sp. OV279]SHG08284.1 hypothetical protein SAMN02787100_3446 [Chryseobacterium sp. OV279]
MIKGLLIFLVLFFGTFKSQIQVPTISDEEMYDVINYIIKVKTGQTKNIKVITEDINYRAKQNDDYFLDIKILKNDFNQKDIKSIKQQYEDSEGFVLNPKYIQNLMIIHKAKLLAYKSEGKYFWDEFNKKHGKTSFMFVGKPLFSLDKSRVIISYGHYCGGLCGNGERVLLKKVNGIWTLERTLSGFIS